MSRFYGSLSGQAQTDATRQGSTKSGIACHVRGWDVGVEVRGYAVGEEDAFEVYATGGSNRRLADQYLGVVKRVGQTLVFVPARVEERV